MDTTLHDTHGRTVMQKSSDCACLYVAESDGATTKHGEQSKASTLILGESGTGKELLARLIHQASPRRDNSMIELNCAALLFGSAQASC